MGIYKSEPYKYGADADGNRYEWRTDVEIISDVSGDELNQDEIYEYDNQLCSFDELFYILDPMCKNATKNLKCSYCNDIIEKGELYYELDGNEYHEDCFKDWMNDMFHISAEEAIEKYSD